jgi:hypothetical protein
MMAGLPLTNQCVRTGSGSDRIKQEAKKERTLYPDPVATAPGCDRPSLNFHVA